VNGRYSYSIGLNPLDVSSFALKTESMSGHSFSGQHSTKSERKLSVEQRILPFSTANVDGRAKLESAVSFLRS